MIHLERLHFDGEQLEIDANDSYIRTYPEFLKYFENIDVLDEHHLVVASHFVYGWMPTIIHLKLDQTERVINLLNRAKKGELLDVGHLNTLKSAINNSLVGLSKLLHFINPSIYAIWDSRIYRYVSGKKSQYGIDNPLNYLSYLTDLRAISGRPEFNSFYTMISSHFDYRITPMRAMEIVMFETDRKSQHSIK
jgi:hypothetical protein